ncbi:hypothetical protein GLIP_1605 [Aliiglaciecola lipolytica E3]|uniref:Uncharacterized protein n=1 Tax=Aliiglaciecola lipolytica E3 TaxID=1127673 RepID=K6X0N8_9ALTE|nr:hypothetical protein GLIP_1605 [Aliiglaciecola lipolytica E3]
MLPISFLNGKCLQVDTVTLTLERLHLASKRLSDLVKF